MTKRDALDVLIKHAMSDCAGVGTGIRSLPSPKERRRVGEAIEKVWKQAYGWTMTTQDKYNRQLSHLFIDPEAK